MPGAARRRTGRKTSWPRIHRQRQRTAEYNKSGADLSAAPDLFFTTGEAELGKETVPFLCFDFIATKKPCSWNYQPQGFLIQCEKLLYTNFL